MSRGRSGRSGTSTACSSPTGRCASTCPFSDRPLNDHEPPKKRLAVGRQLDSPPQGASRRDCFRFRALKEAANGFAVDPEADDAAGAVDLVDRVGRNHAAAAREKAGLDRERVRDVRSRAVHRTLDLADETALAIGDDVAGGPAEVDCVRAHLLPTLFPVCNEIPRHEVKGLLTPPTMSG